MKSKNLFMGFVITISVLTITFVFYGYQVLLTPNLQVDKPDKMLYIPTGATFQTVMDSLEKNDMINENISFRFLSKLSGYQDKVHPGAYLIKSNASNKNVVWMLRSGSQTPVKLTFNNIRTKEELAQKLSSRIEATEQELLAMFNNPDTAKAYGFNEHTFVSMFIPNTYEMYWNISVGSFFRRMQKEYDAFWTAERRAKAAAIGMTPEEVSVLASITEAETKKRDEMPRVAGVYINRLKKNWKLQADPTVVFAVGDFTIKRVRKGHTDMDSPYNTYMHEGLPPGPINIPSMPALDAVLNYEKHDYMFFVAREDFSGYHTFAVDYNTHLRNARVYQKALDAAKL
jgi:UPF0755 protein